MLDKAEVMRNPNYNNGYKTGYKNIISAHKIYIIIERAHTTCNVAATVRCKEG